MLLSRWLFYEVLGHDNELSLDGAGSHLAQICLWTCAPTNRRTRLFLAQNWVQKSSSSPTFGHVKQWPKARLPDKFCCGRVACFLVMCFESFLHGLKNFKDVLVDFFDGFSYWCFVGNQAMIHNDYESSHSPIPYSAPVSLFASPWLSTFVFEALSPECCCLLLKLG